MTATGIQERRGVLESGSPGIWMWEAFVIQNTAAACTSGSRSFQTLFIEQKSESGESCAYVLVSLLSRAEDRMKMNSVREGGKRKRFRMLFAFSDEIRDITP